jgi:2-dehydro-3-deoxygluconokinase
LQQNHPGNKGPLRFNHTFQKTIGGAELNVAIGASRLGIKTTFYSKVGDDEFGQYIINTLRGESVDVSSIKKVSNKNTSVYFKQINADGSGKSFYYRDNAPITDITVKDIEKINFKEFDYLHISGVFVALLNKKLKIIQSLMEKAKSSGVTVLLDPNIRLKTWDQDLASKCLVSLLPYADILLTSDEELETLKISEYFENKQELFQKHNLKELVIKRGHKSTLYYDGKENFEVEVFTVNPLDTVGAGDGFTCGYLYAMSQGYNSHDKIKFANAVGGMVTEVIGDNEGLPYLEQVEKFLYNLKSIDR